MNVKRKVVEHSMTSVNHIRNIQKSARMTDATFERDMILQGKERNSARVRIIGNIKIIYRIEVIIWND